MQTLKRKVSFLDKAGHRAKITAEITERNGYPEFTASGSYLGSFGQCLDNIKPRTSEQRQLIGLWKEYHLTNLDKIPANVKFWPDFAGHLTTILNAIEKQEKDNQDKKLADLMAEYDIEDTEAAQVYLNITGADDLEDFEESYQGHFSSDEEFAKYIAEELGAMKEEGINWPYTSIDWERAAHELMYDYSEQNGHYFRNL